MSISNIVFCEKFVFHVMYYVRVTCVKMNKTISTKWFPLLTVYSCIKRRLCDISGRIC